MEARDAIVSWLEQGDNFLRSTAAFPFSPRRDVVQTEGAALGELAAFVNRSVPRANWDARHAKQMLKHYLLQFRSTAEAAANPRVSLDERDALRGLQTVQDKLDDMCRHFQRLQRLHNRAQERDMGPGLVSVKLTETRRRGRERAMDVVVPESDLSNSCDNSEADRKTGAMRVVQPTVSGQKEENNDKRSQEIGSFSQSVQSTQSKGKETRKRAKAVRDKQEQKKRTEKQEAKEKQILASATPLIALASDEEDVDEELPTLRRSTRATRQSPGKAVQDGASSTRKRARREPTPKKTDQVEGVDVTSAQTTKGASSSASNDPQDSLMNDENTPNLNTRSQDHPLQRRKFGTAPKPVQFASGPVSGEAQLEEAIHTEAPQHKKQPPQQPPSPPSSSHNHSRKSTPGSAVPDAYRSAIAEVISQRKQLLSRIGDADSQASPTQEKRQRSLSESDYGLSDIELPSTDPKPSIPRNNLRNSKSMDAPRSRHESGPTAGLLPPLIDAFRTESGKSNLKQKRIFHRAKELAFEQLKWHRENELQQCELELLRREMEALEALALQELQLKRMRVRADIIQHMISAGASVADIAERLSLL